MRTIKFRFYSNHLGKFVTPDDSIFVGALKDPDMNPMQFTGLHDKNGKEIYEGDIVIGLGVVKWYDKDAKYMLYFNNGDKPTVELNAAQFSEIIGNIYENPELVK